ncbi:unnamed protein product [[Candida] boidinii]|nr:unnamed protein product [[Candida] boidinii]
MQLLLKTEAAKPAASGGFSFGAKPSTDSADASTKPATSSTPAAGGFSFGAKTDASKDASKSNTAAAASGGFAFGAKPAEKNAPEKAVVIKDTNEKTSIKTEDIRPQPISIKNKTLEDLITRWTNQLTTASKTFENYSSKVGEWDNILVSSSERISQLSIVRRL